MQTQTQDETIYDVTQEQPDVNESVLVFAKGFRCLGYLASDGVWRYDTDGFPIENVMKWTRNSRP